VGGEEKYRVMKPEEKKKKETSSFRGDCRGSGGGPGQSFAQGGKMKGGKDQKRKSMKPVMRLKEKRVTTLSFRVWARNTETARKDRNEIKTGRKGKIKTTPQGTLKKFQEGEKSQLISQEKNGVTLPILETAGGEPRGKGYY